MRITNTTPQYISNSYGNSGSDAARSRNPKPLDELTRGDNISLSETTRDMQKISRAMEFDPPERQQRVAELKHQVQTGQYKINAEHIAEKIIGSIMNEVG